MRRLQVAAGVAAACVGSFNLPAVELQQLSTTWPYALAVYAAASFGAALTEPIRLLPPLALGSVAIITVAQLDVGNLWPLALTLAGIFIALAGPSSPEPASVVNTGWTRRIRYQSMIPEEMSITSILGSVHLDLRGATGPGASTVHLTTYAASIMVRIPASWRVTLSEPPSASVGVREDGARDSIDPTGHILALAVRGTAGLVVVTR